MRDVAFDPLSNMTYTMEYLQRNYNKVRDEIVKQRGIARDILGLADLKLGPRLDDGKCDSTVPVVKKASEVREQVSFPTLKLYREEDWKFLNIPRPSNPFDLVMYGRNDSRSNVDYNHFICPRCGKDVRFVIQCIPPQLESGPRRYSFDADTVVDANPNRSELT